MAKMTDDAISLFNILIDVTGHASYSCENLNQIAERLTDEGWRGAPGSHVPAEPLTPEPAGGYSLPVPK